jgi:hypothetical protein
MNVTPKGTFLIKETESYDALTHLLCQQLLMATTIDVLQTELRLLL